MTTPSDELDDAFPATHLTWTALLGHWIDFSRAAIGLPDTGQGQAMRASVPDVVMLQAIWFSLEHLDQLAPSQRALGLDRAQVLFDQHTEALGCHWASEPMPGKLAELIEDVRSQLRAADEAGES